MTPRIALAAAILVLASCGSNIPDREDDPPPAPDCAVGSPTAVIAAGGCMDGTEWQAVAVFSCDNGRRLYGIDNRWAWVGDDWWTIGGQPLWDACRTR